MTETVWLLTTLLINGHIVESTTMDQHTCRKAEMYAAMSMPFQFNSPHGPIPVAGAVCQRFESKCPDTGTKLAMLNKGD